MKDKTIGIIGGMGPEATIDIFQKIIDYTNVNQEEEHLHIVIDNNPKLPNRQNAILQGSESPLPMLIEMAQNLERNGADFLIMAANTPHYYYADICKHITISFLHMIEETASYIHDTYPEVSKVGILATKAMTQTGIYQEAMARQGLEVINISSEQQSQLQTEILAFKNMHSKKDLHDVVENMTSTLVACDAQVLLLACTELPLVFTQQDSILPIINPNEVIARAAVRMAKGDK